MKKIILLILCLTITILSFSQLNKRNWLVGGSGSFYSYSETYIAPPPFSYDAKYTSIDISASIGYFIMDKFAGGLRPTFSSFKGQSTGVGGVVYGTTNSYKLAIGPFIRYYFLPKEKPFNILTDISYQFGVNQFLGALNEKGKYNTLSIMGGSEFFFNSSVGLEILVGYVEKTASIENSPSAYTDKRKGFQTTIGFQIHLEKL